MIKQKRLHISDAITTIFMVIAGILFFILAPRLALLFTDTVEVQQKVVLVIRFIAFFQPFAAMTQIMTNALQGAGDTKFPMYSTIIGIWVIRVLIGGI